MVKAFFISESDSVLSKIKGDKGSCVYIDISATVQAPLVDTDSVEL
jgi:hypothetical protein